MFDVVHCPPSVSKSKMRHRTRDLQDKARGNTPTAMEMKCWQQIPREMDIALGMSSELQTNLRSIKKKHFKNDYYTTGICISIDRNIDMRKEEEEEEEEGGRRKEEGGRGRGRGRWKREMEEEGRGTTRKDEGSSWLAGRPAGWRGGGKGDWKGEGGWEKGEGVKREREKEKKETDTETDGQTDRDRGQRRLMWPHRAPARQSRRATRMLRTPQQWATGLRSGCCSWRRHCQRCEPPGTSRGD